MAALIFAGRLLALLALVGLCCFLACIAIRELPEKFLIRRIK